MSDRMQCPKCNAEIGGHAQLIEQGKAGERTLIKVGVQNGAMRMFDANAIGKMLSAYSQAIETIANNLGEKVCVYIANVTVDESSIEFEMATAVKLKGEVPNG